ncbi:hypothetical protein [Bosea sp. NPDC055594]
MMENVVAFPKQALPVKAIAASYVPAPAPVAARGLMRPALLTLAQLSAFALYMAGFACWAFLFFIAIGG